MTVKISIGKEQLYFDKTYGIS